MKQNQTDEKDDIYVYAIYLRALFLRNVVESVSLPFAFTLGRTSIEKSRSDVLVLNSQGSISEE